ncbi:unnamed protein product [Rotaria magnacalcarata]|uniref:Peptidase S9 prolyl oligopeptidase catalytic domain-containing protein n=1 Tax=Rotaria magnacalcarata TaxID=392030 RepID=A0A816QEV5_9BILA|nr:unnamed protein product [Rotaria magnacalcarata]CAF2059048.1 unnamed protein product [Rotaria magnacalcarata]CAF3942287.1 unnamed protein product [Rotaria magnacalcarata]CAF3964110.1 unnamed protein product [Rotaria magnacalcarata]
MGGEPYPMQSKTRRYAFPLFLFLLGALIVFIPCIIVIVKNKKNCPSPGPSPVPPVWNASDYQSNSEYYANVPIHDFKQEDNLRLDRLASPKFHPIDGSSVIYLRTQYHMPDLNGSTTTLHWLNLKKIDEKKFVQLTRPIWGIRDQQFYWVHDRTILFLSNRATSGLTQIFQLNLPADLTKVTSFIEPIQITDYPLNIDNLLVNRAGSRLAFSCQVFANLSIEETVARQKKEETSGQLMYQFDKLFIRHWDEYMIGPRHHPFVVSIERDSKGTFKFASTPVDVLLGIDSDSPTRPFGDAQSQWSFSASGNSFAFTRQHDESSEVAWTTNLDIYTVDLSATKLSVECITCSNLAADTDPRYSPIEDHVLVYRSQAVPGYESDQFKVKLHNGVQTITLLDSWDRSIDTTIWSNDGESLFLVLGERANHNIYRLYDVHSSNSTDIRPVAVAMGSWHDINVHPTDNQTLLLTHDNFVQPANIIMIDSSVIVTNTTSLTSHNEILLSKTRLSYIYESFSFEGARDEIVEGWHLAPVSGITEKAPLAFLIHGGPQNSWYNNWGRGWSFQAYAAQGYAVIAINFHGSDSYGQNFTDSITGEYGTLPYEDLKLGLTAALKNYTYIDENRVVALGASYGGYMINWIAGHPEMSQRFRALVCHDGLFDMRGMAYSTEELWFSEHDAGGFTPYDNPEAFERFNPVNHVANWTQPMLIIHGGRDYRVPDVQGISAFTALQRRNITSRLLFFPKENHWVLNLMNLLAWYREVFDWMRRWTQ